MQDSRQDFTKNEGGGSYSEFAISARFPGKFGNDEGGGGLLWGGFILYSIDGKCYIYAWKMYHLCLENDMEIAHLSRPFFQGSARQHDLDHQLTCLINFDPLLHITRR